MKFTATQIAGLLEGEIEGNANAEVSKLAKIEELLLAQSQQSEEKNIIIQPEPQEEKKKSSFFKKAFISSMVTGGGIVLYVILARKSINGEPISGPPTFPDNP